MARKKQLIIPVFIPFGGCPHRCIFCDQEGITGASTLPANADVVRTVERYLATWNDGNRGRSNMKKEIAFYGGSFTALPPDAQEGYLKTAHGFVLSGRVDSLRVSTRPDCISRDSLRLLKRYGAGTIELGVQSLSDEVLRLSGRGHTSCDTVRAVAMIKLSGMRVGMQLMPGLPGDTEDSIVETAEKAVGLRPDLVRLYPTLVIKDTPLHKMYLDGRYAPWGLGEMVGVLRRVLALFEEAGIPVARVGLHPSGELERSIVAGPYHPSLRAFVKQGNGKTRDAVIAEGAGR
ncbi:MAG: radical SAM protein [Deltaproteobacteria bacterium]|nr:radical SAM protein [Deltaproteobacteria bacterium]